MARPKAKGYWLVIATIALVILYFVSRLSFLTNLPIFTDEAIYIRWSQIGGRDPAWRFISLTDGKQPLFTWMVMAALRLFKDPLFAGRFVSIVAGFASAVGVWLLSFELFRNRRLAYIASLMYIISPFALFYDRMALYDSLVATLSVWNLWLAVLLVKRLTLDIALLFGMTLGIGMLNKSSGFLSLYFLPFTLVLFDFKRAALVRRLFVWLGLVIVAAVISQFFYSILRLSPFFYIIAQKDKVFIYSLSEWLSHPFTFLMGNLRGLFDWLTSYLTWPVWLAALASFVVSRRAQREKLLLVLWWIAPFISLALFGKVLFPRFILFMSLPLLVLTAFTSEWAVARFGRKLVIALLVAILLVPSLYSDYLIITNPAAAPIPQTDKGQYINDWPAGGGVKEVAAFLAQEAAGGKISVFTEGTFGLMPYGLEIYLDNNPNIAIKGIWPLPQEFPAEIRESALERATFVVLNQSQSLPSPWPLILEAEYQKGTRLDRKLRLYRVILPQA